MNDSDVISRALILSMLRGTAAQSLDISVYRELVSTNDTVRELALSGAAEGVVVIADAQTGGRGRLGRSFCSPPGTGLYMSLLLRPDFPAANASLITAAAAVAVCEAIEARGIVNAGIKWVNDIIIGGRKVCGILTESSTDATGGIRYAVLGIGLNIFPPENGFPPELSDIAGCVYSEYRKGARERLTADILNYFMRRYRDADALALAEDYRKRSTVVGKTVTVIRGDGRFEAEAVGIDDSCALIVNRRGGGTERLCGGEISVRF